MFPKNVVISTSDYTTLTLPWKPVSVKPTICDFLLAVSYSLCPVTLGRVTLSVVESGDSDIRVTFPVSWSTSMLSVGASAGIGGFGVLTRIRGLGVFWR